MAATDGGADGAIASDTPAYAALLDSDDLSDDDEDFDPASYVLTDAEISAAFGGDATDRLAMFERLGWTRSPRRASEVGTQPVAQDSPDQLRNADDSSVYELPGYISNEEEDEEDDEDAQREAILPAVLAGAIMDAAEEPDRIGESPLPAAADQPAAGEGQAKKRLIGPILYIELSNT